MIRQKSTQAETLAKFLQRHLQSMEGLMTLDIGGTKGNMVRLLLGHIYLLLMCANRIESNLIFSGLF